MDYFTFLTKKSLRIIVITTIAILVVWGAIYHLTDMKTICVYVLIGFIVCLINSIIPHLYRKSRTLFSVKGNWVIMAGVVLLLYHAGFEGASVFAAAVITALPFFGGTIYESIIGISLLITLAHQM